MCPGFDTFIDTMPRIGRYRLTSMVQATKTEKLSNQVAAFHVNRIEDKQSDDWVCTGGVAFHILTTSKLIVFADVHGNHD
jgi:hypothetical protein